MKARRADTPPDGLPPMKPQARKDGLVVQDLPEETLVYDLERDRAHCLNRAAALVWRHCDGRTTPSDLARMLENEVGLPDDEAVIHLALERLAKAHLLEGQAPRLPAAAHCTRRDVLRRLGAAAGLAVLLPAVQSIVAPEAAQAASMITNTQCWNDPTGMNGKCCSNNHRQCSNAFFGLGLCIGPSC
jgi:hypothetical protein